MVVWQGGRAGAKILEPDYSAVGAKILEPDYSSGGAKILEPVYSASGTKILARGGARQEGRVGLVGRVGQVVGRRAGSLAGKASRASGRELVGRVVLVGRVGQTGENK